MKSRFLFFVYEWRFSTLLSGIFVATATCFYYWTSGTFSSQVPPWYFSSLREFQGMVLLFIIMPTYIVMSGFYSQRRSLELATQIDKDHDLHLSASLQNLSRRSLIGCGLLGFIYAALFNVSSDAIYFFSSSSLERAMIFGQISIWVLLGMLLYIRIHCARQFRAASHQVQIDIFATAKLKPFAQVGLIDILIIVIGLMLSTVQSLDFSFRPDNYSKALVIILPAICYLSLYPMWGLHLAMKKIRQEQLTELESLVKAASKSLKHDDITLLVSLLQRRERVLTAPTWPIDIAFLQRLIIYIIIPPLAWVAAALVEYLLAGFLGNQ